jgi:hypothetical protein
MTAMRARSPRHARASRSGWRVPPAAVLAAVRRRPWHALAICVPLLAASVLTGTTVASAHPEPTLAVPKAALNAAPAPFVRSFTSPLTGKPGPAHKHPRRVPIGWNVDGCDHDYGTPNVCVPWKIPPAAGSACGWLKANGFGPVRVYGRDRQHLDTNQDGIACDTGDLGAA